MDPVSRGQPVPGDRRHPHDIIGRDREQSALQAGIDAALKGQGALLILSGEAGMGKTTLVNWGTDYARHRGALVLEGYSYPAAAPRPYGPWLQMVQRYSSTAAISDELRQLQAGTSIDIEDKTALQGTFDRFIDDASAVQPLLLVFEDLQWADESTAELLHFVSRRLANRPVVLLSTLRDDEITSDHPVYPWLTTISRELHGERVALSPLDDQSILEIARRFAGLSANDELRLLGYLRDRSGGNPFFAIELLRMLNERRILYPVDDRWQLGTLPEDDVPSLVHQIITGRLAPLDAKTRALLEATSVAGIEADLDSLLALFPGTSDELDRALNTAIEHRLLSLDPERFVVTFGHELVRSAVYNTVPPLRRRRMHRQLGESMAGQTNPQPDIVAEHLFRAGDELAIDWLAADAELAHNLYAPQAVRDRCERALYLAKRLGVRAPWRVHRLLGLAHETLGNHRAARESLESATRIAAAEGDQRGVWQSLIDLGALWAALDYDHSMAYVEQALACARDIDDPSVIAETLNRLGNCYINGERFGEGIEAHQEALSIFESIDDSDGIAATLDLLGVAHVLASDTATGVEYYRKAIPLLRRLDHRRTLVTALVTAAAAQFGAEHALYATSMQHRAPTDRAVRYAQLDDALTIAREIGWLAGESFTLAIRANVATNYGEFDIALRDSQKGIEIARDIGHLQWQILGLCSLGSLLRELMDIDQARACFEEAQRLATHTGSQFMTGLATAFLASSCIEAGDLNAASALIEPELLRASEHPTTTRLNLTYAMVELSHTRGDDETALELLDQLDNWIPGPENHRAPQMLRVRAQVLTATRQFIDAESLLQTARNTAERYGYLPALRSCLLALHQVYLHQGKTLMAEQTREHAMTVTGRLANSLKPQFPDLAEQYLTKTAEAMPESVPFARNNPAANASDTLTRRELDVLSLVAEGLSDVEVSERLFISHRTVSQHLRSIYGKLDVNNRTAAVRTASERNLLTPDQ